MSSRIKKYLELAAYVSRIKGDSRTYFHGAVAERRDGVLVAASNGAPKEPTPRHHCEFRILRKLGRDGIIYLVRTLADGTWADSTPCIHCEKAIRAHRVNMVHYTTGDRWVYESWNPSDPRPLKRSITRASCV